MAETWTQRKERESVRDAIRDLGWEVAEHVAGGEMLAVERGERGAVQFSGRTSEHRCDCGLPLIPLPNRLGRYGWLPLWVCGVCSLECIVRDLGPAVLAEAERRAKEQA